MSQPILALSGLSVHLEQQRILQGVDLTLRAGEVLAILGASGSGKSTLLRYLGGEGPGRAHISAWPEKVSTAAQAPLLYPWMSVWENLVLGRRSSDHSAARELLGHVGLAHTANLRPHQLSGGMRARVALARAFMPGQQLVLLDEPFAALDVVTADNLRQLTRDLLRRQRQAPAVILVSHDLDEALSMGDQINVLAASGDGWQDRLVNPRAARESQEYLELRARLVRALEAGHPLLALRPTPASAP